MRDVRTLADLTRSRAAEDGSRTALVSGERCASFAVLDAAASRVANALFAEGVERGSRVALLGADSEHSFEVLFGAAKAGAVAVSVSTRLASPEIGFILDDSETRVLFVGPELLPKLREVAPALPHLRRVVVLGPESPEAPSYPAWRDAHAAADPFRPADPEEVVCQMYTSGTTGRPKGVQLANRSFFAVVGEMARRGDPWIGWSAADTSLLALPTYHIGGLWWAVTGLNAGACNVVMESFVAWRAIELLEQHRVTKTCVVPAMLQLMLSEPACKRADFAALDCIVYGGSPIPLALLERALATFGCRFAQIYGLTETGNTAVCLRPEDHLAPDSKRLQAAGRPYPGVQVKVLDERGAELGPGRIGELCIRSPANMVGYWKRPEATAETLRDGWVHTGDVGYVDGAGYVFVCDRVKDMIIYAGENVYPAEIESVLAGHPAVREAAVIGVPDERWGELVKALVVLEPDAKATAAELQAHVRRGLAEFKVPKSVDFVASLPRTPSGKLKKAELRRPFWEGRERQVN